MERLHAEDPRDRHPRQWRVSRQRTLTLAAASALFMGVSLIGLVAADAIPTTKANHHHCVHDEKVSRFEESVDAESLVVPQSVVPFESPSEQEVNTYLEIVGASRGNLRSPLTGRSLASSATASAFQPMRIVFDVSKLSSDPGYMCTAEGVQVQLDGGPYTCASGDVLTSEKREFIVSVLLKSIEDYFEQVLSVQRVMGNLIIKGIGCSTTDEWACCSRSIPPSYKTEGVADADYVLHVTARPTSGATIAWALPCNIDQFGRPVSGQANFGPARIDPVTAAARSEQIGTALHEMTHALVFSKGRFYDFRQPLNGAKWGYNNVVSQTQGSGGIWVSKIVTPVVAKQAKQQFNCYDWVNAGIELENGDSGSADFSSHWEKRMLMNEYMTATSSYDPVYSALTLALFEDSGWYQVSYKQAQTLPWGYMEGCGVAQGRCSSWNSRYICNQASQTGCTADYSSKGYCNVASYTSSIPAGFQYFEDTKFGGRDTYADYCPFYRAYSNGDCRGIGRIATAADTNNNMETIGPSSKCFTSSLSKSSSDTAATRATCYKVLGCTNAGIRLSIGDKEVLCPMEGGEMRVSGYKGKIVCPVANRLCQMLQDKCSGNGVLQASGTCQCNAGYVGEDCSGISCPLSSANNQECGGSSQGTCDYTKGACTCTAAYTGLSCSELVCPAVSSGKNTSECSGHGSCDRAFGQCNCQNGYSGKACECVPGCTASTCGLSGTCDCTTGACSCNAGYSGIDCSNASNAPITELKENTTTITDTIASKAYKFYKISLASSTYDLTFVVEYQSNTSVDVDLYGSFIEQYPTSLSSKTRLFMSDYGIGDRDEINLCGSLGVFPRGLNSTFRYCAQPTSSYILETPGYFYLAVFGYAGGQFKLSIVADQCKNVTCSNHGACGVNYPGVCTCDRYWSGDDCSIPRCGPDCRDLGNCNSSAITDAISGDGDAKFAIESETASADAEDSETVNYATSGTAATLQSTSECYGNGVCRVGTDAKGKEVPQCVCEDAFTFANPSASQALCKELLPWVASVQRFTGPFRVTTSTNPLKINSWALFTIQVKDEWEVLVATLDIKSTETDAMLFVRKEKLPSVVVANSSATSSFLQFTDSDGWTSGSSTRKVVLTRATSTLSSGLYYIGVFNSPYARAALSYSIAVNATGNCTSTDADGGYGVCLNGATCNAQSSQICTCPDGFVGKYCDLRATRAVLSPTSLVAGSSNASTDSNSTAANASTPSSTVSYMAFRSPDISLLDIGEWVYFSFDIDDTSVVLAQFRLVIYNDLSGSTPVQPLLLVRGPSEDGFPTLFTESQQDFLAVSRRESVQTVTVSVDKACSFASSSKSCYKVALFNRKYSGEALRYRLEVELFKSKATIFPSTVCGTTGNKANCNDNGKCLLVSSANDTTSKTTTMPTCKCNTGWMGLRCNSPKSFDLPQLWSAINNISLLCSTCNSSFSMARGEVKMFRVPASLRDNTGLRLRVRPVVSTVSGNASATGTNPNVYVSETLPRSLYDFTHISTSNDSTSSGQVVQLTNDSFTGLFWVVVFAEYPASDVVEVSTSSVSGGRWRQRRLLHSPHALRLLGSDASTSQPVRFQLEAEIYALSDGVATTLLTQQSFTREVFNWLFHTPIGVGVFVFSLIFLTLLVCFCLWRVCNAPENQDKATRRFFGGDPTSQTHYPTGTALGRVGGNAMVSDIELGARSTRTTRHA